MAEFIIIKNLRYYEKIRYGYTGPSCLIAKVQPGKVYNSEKEASLDAEKLSKVNPIGFKVVEVE